MNIIIPLCGKGIRFHSKGYTDPKPLIKVFEKEIIFYILDNIYKSENDTIYIVINERLAKSNIQEIIRKKYPTIEFIHIHGETSGAAETVYKALENIHNDKSCLLIDGDNFYTVDIVAEINKCKEKNQVIYFETEYEKPIFSYIQMNEEQKITCIKEKDKISKYANTGAYYFVNKNELYETAKHIVETKSYKLEPFISTIIEKLLVKTSWYGTKIDENYYFSLGTPEQVEAYKKKTFAFLFDLDGTLVNTDNLYFNVWKDILIDYNITLTKEIYDTYIYSNNDTQVAETLLSKVKCNLDTLSQKKELLFDKYINSIITMDNAVNFINNLKLYSNKIGIVTNSNRQTAQKILSQIGISYDILIIGCECDNPKPSADPYFKALDYFKIDPKKVIIFEDSKNGITSAKGVNPLCIVGISENHKYVFDAGADLTFKDFHIPLSDLLSFNRKKTEFDIIISNSLRKVYPSLKNILINQIQLKGGFIADVYSVEYIIDEKLHKVIMKLENENSSMLNKMAHFLNLYNRETYFYESISKFVPINVPNCYGILRDSDYKVIGFLLEDCREYATINKNLNKESLDVSLTVIDSLAKLHSSFWNKGEMFESLKKHNHSNYQPSWMEFLKSKVELFISRWEHIMNSFQVELFKKVVNSFNKIQNELSKPPLTLCHGDVKSPNIFYSDKGPYFIDWQYIANGKGVQDLVFFMIESFSNEKIKLYYPVFKNYYYTKLLEYGVKDYSFNEYEKDIMYAMFHFPFFVALWFGTCPKEDLIDVNFPFFYIQRLLNFYELVYNKDSIDLES